MSHIARESIVGNHEHSTNLCASKEFEKETYYTGYCMVRFNPPPPGCILQVPQKVSYFAHKVILMFMTSDS